MLSAPLRHCQPCQQQNHHECREKRRHEASSRPLWCRPVHYRSRHCGRSVVNRQCERIGRRSVRRDRRWRDGAGCGGRGAAATQRDVSVKSTHRRHLQVIRCRLSRSDDGRGCAVNSVQLTSLQTNRKVSSGLQPSLSRVNEICIMQACATEQISDADCKGPSRGSA